MHFFEYPYVIITILVIIFILMGLIGLYFTIKSVRTSKGTAEKSFCSIGKIETDFQKSVSARENHCIIYISLSLDNMKRLYSESSAIRMYDQIKHILFNHFAIKISGEISTYGSNSLIAFNKFKPKAIINCINECYEEINKTFVKYTAVNVVSIHFGFYCSSSTDVPFKTALARAKQACSMAETSDDLYCEWDSSNGKSYERQIKIENNIHSEIENNRFFLEYQPIIDAKTNTIIGAEVLSRLNSTTEGILTPNHFITAVNNVGLNEKFDYYIFEKNCKWISNNKEDRTKYTYTINFSRQTLCDKNFADSLVKIIEEYGIDYSCIAVEVLEDKELINSDKIILISNLKRLKEKGVLILLDDFGKGYSGFSDLAEFDISIVKIDMSLTQNAITETGFLILKNLIQAAHDLGFKTLCEGIETEEHKTAVVNAGCDMLQGFYFHHPMSATQLEKLF